MLHDPHFTSYEIKQRLDDVLSDASDSDVGSVLSDDESEVDISEYGNIPTLPDMKSPAPGSVLGGLLGELKLQHKDLDRTASPFRAAPSPGLARVMTETPMSGTFSGLKTGTPLVDAGRGHKRSFKKDLYIETVHLLTS